MKALRQQRDELLTALKQIVLWYECDLALIAEPIKQAKAAIAMAEGGAARKSGKNNTLKSEL